MGLPYRTGILILITLSVGLKSIQFDKIQMSFVLLRRIVSYSKPLVSSQPLSTATANANANANAALYEGSDGPIEFLSLNNLSDNAGAVKIARRVGRGIGSSKGKTCGRGHKGQKSRSGGGVKPFFEGGQTPFHKRIPKRGFTNPHATPMVPINVGTLQDYIDMGRLSISDDRPITIKDLCDAGVTKKSSVKHGVKLLSHGKERLRDAINIEISRASKGAIDAIEGAKGNITTVHYNRLALKALLKPQKFDVIPKRARPPPKLMPYYTSYENRGYLSPQVQLRQKKGITIEKLVLPNDEITSTE